MIDLDKLEREEFGRWVAYAKHGGVTLGFMGGDGDIDRLELCRFDSVVDSFVTTDKTIGFILRFVSASTGGKDYALRVKGIKDEEFGTKLLTIDEPTRYKLIRVSNMLTEEDRKYLEDLKAGRIW